MYLFLSSSVCCCFQLLDYVLFNDHFSGGRLKAIGEKLRLPDDCVIGYIIGKICNIKTLFIDRPVNLSDEKAFPLQIFWF